MTQDEIVKMAREAGLVRTGDKWVEPARWGVTELVHFANLVAAAARAEENEACAKFIEHDYVRQFERPWRDDYYKNAIDVIFGNLSAAIRARGNI